MAQLRKAMGLLGLGTLLFPQAAAAYGVETHAKIPDAAVQAMYSIAVRAKDMEYEPEVPAGIPSDERALYEQYLAAVALAPAALVRMRTGLTDVTAAKDAPTGLDADWGYGFPIRNAAAHDDVTRDLVVQTCPLASCETKNLWNVADFEIGQLDYFPVSASPCGLDPLVNFPDYQTKKPGESDADFEERKQVAVLGRTMGWHARSIDHRINDTAIWFKPSLMGPIGVVVNDLSNVWTYGVGALIAPFACLYGLFSGAGCDLGEGFDLADQINPVDAFSNTLPGIGDVRSELFIGMWHFVHVEASSNRYNDVRGLWWPGAGPTTGIRQGPSIIDVGLAATLTIAGAALNEDKAEGIDRYGKYDQKQDQTERLYWEAESFAITEFSSLPNMAQFGWDTFAASATDGSGTQPSAFGLSWVLHALGDAAAPQHVVGTTGYGHATFEKYVDENLPTYYLSEATEPDEIAVEAQHGRIVENGFFWWKRLRAGLSVKEYVLELARETRRMSLAGDDWALNDAVASFPSYESTLEEHQAEGRALLEMSSGASLAMLMYAATVVDEELSQASQSCPTGTGFGRFSSEGYYGCTANAVCCDEGVVQCSGNENCGENESCEGGCCVPEVTTCLNVCASEVDCPGTPICVKDIDADEGCCVEQVD